jgi:hypothetical protein
MRQISEGIYGLLVSQGIEAGRAGNTGRHGMKVRGAASDGAHSRVVADTPEQEGDLMCPPIGRQGGWQPMGISGKGPGVNAPAKSDSLRVVVDNSRNWRTQAPRVAPLGVRQFLVLVQ